MFRVTLPPPVLGVLYITLFAFRNEGGAAGESRGRIGSDHAFKRLPSEAVQHQQSRPSESTVRGISSFHFLSHIRSCSLC